MIYLLRVVFFVPRSKRMREFTNVPELLEAMSPKGWRHDAFISSDASLTWRTIRTQASVRLGGPRFLPTRAKRPKEEKMCRIFWRYQKRKEGSVFRGIRDERGVEVWRCFWSSLLDLSVRTFHSFKIGHVSRWSRSNLKGSFTALSLYFRVTELSFRESTISVCSYIPNSETRFRFQNQTYLKW